MIRSTLSSDLPYLLGRVRELTEAFKAGDHESADAFRDLVALFFTLTVGTTDHPRLTYLSGSRDKSALGGMGGLTTPLCLADGRYLKLVINLSLEPAAVVRRLKVFDSSYQYQCDADGKDWVFRYDYQRNAPNRHPPSHLHVRGDLHSSGVLMDGQTLERVHFAMPRVSIEAVLRLLIEQFNVPTAEPAEIWRPVLHLSETLFSEIAHQPQSGPSE